MAPAEVPLLQQANPPEADPLNWAARNPVNRRTVAKPAGGRPPASGVRLDRRPATEGRPTAMVASVDMTVVIDTSSV
jgi:hypothetical protein